MVRHVVMFSFKDQAEGCAKAENVAKTKAMLEALPAKIPQIRAQTVACNDAQAEAGNYDLVLISDFDSYDDLRAYLSHPDHVAVGQFMSPRRLARACVDFTV